MEYVFDIPSKVLMAPGISKSAGEYLKKENYDKVLLICDKNLSQIGLINPLVNAMKENGIDVEVFDNIVGEPPYTVVREAVAVAKEKGLSAVIGMGGGSAMDAAKCTLVSLGNGDIEQYLDTMDEIENREGYLILIPTTFGTASELTNGGILSVPETGSKEMVWGKNCGADLALVDPELALGLPPALTAGTGLDAFAHAVESYMGTMPSEITDVLSEKAMRIIVEWLPKCYKDGANLENREHMCLACTMAGLSFANGRTNQGHEFSHAIGAKFHIPHGIACALAVPLAIRANAEFFPEKMKVLADIFGIEAGTLEGKDLEDAVVEKFLAFRASLGIHGFSQYGITEDKLEDVGDAWDREWHDEYNFLPDRNYVMELVRSNL